MRRFARASVALLTLGVCFLLAVPASSMAASPQVTLGTIQNLSSDSGASTAPVIAVSGIHIYVAREDQTGGKAQTYFTSSTNGGASWSTVTKLTLKGGGASTTVNAVQMAVSGSYVYLTWRQGGKTAYAVSNNYGTSFAWGILSDGSAPGQGGVGAPKGTMTSQALSTNGTSAYFTWNDAVSSTQQDMEFAATYDGGAHFTAPVTLATGTLSHEDENAAIGKYVYVVWDAIWFTASNNGGKPGTWSAQVNLQPTGCKSPCKAREPMISASGSNVYVTYPSDVSGEYQTYVSVSHDYGATFPNGPQLLSTGVDNTRDVQVASSGNNVYVTSRGLVHGSTQQYVYVSNDDGNTFAAPYLLGQEPGSQAGFGDLAVDGNNVYVQWPHGSPAQIYLAASLNSGTNWDTAQQVSSSSSGVVACGDPAGGQGPMIAAINGHVYLVWEDTSTGSGDIFFVASS